jgi:CRP-like cAMP-binding protein
VFVESPLHGIRDRMLALRSLPNFAGLRDESLLYMVEAARERRFRTGEVLLSEGVPVDRIYIVIGGKVTLSRQGKTFLVVEAPGAVGILAAMAHDQAGWHAVANADTLTLEIPVTAFLSNLAEDFGLLRNSLRIMGGMALNARGNLPVKPERAKPPEMGVYPERDATLVERIITLQGTPGPFSSANMDAIIEICRRMTVMRVEAGHTFFNIGEPSSFSIRINYGHLRCTAESGEHVDVGAGMVLGALDAWAGRPRSYTARAETRVVCWRTPVEDFLAVLEMHPSLALSLLKGLAAGLIAGG